MQFPGAHVEPEELLLALIRHQQSVEQLLSTLVQEARTARSGPVGPPDSRSHLEHQEVLNALQALATNIIEAPRTSTTQGLPEWTVQTVKVTNANEAVRGPNVAVPVGYTTVVRQRRHAGSPTGYVAPTEGDLAATGSRSELGDADALELKVSNMNELWFSSDSTVATTGTVFELIVER